METFKLERIKNISEEVKEFHPLLRALFSKLPGIVNIEYTQGPQEMGADFVLTKEDETLDDIEYVGCIVKIGQIKQDHSEVNRQIEECDEERTIEGGTRKIFLSEIWIVSNGNITKGAQTKIHTKYKNKNIKFLSAEKLVLLIDRYYSEYWKDLTVTVGEYLRSVTLYADNLSINSCLPDLRNADIYIQQRLYKKTIKKSLSSKQKERRINKPEKRYSIDEIMCSDYKCILVEATMGTGKSTLVSRLAKEFSYHEKYNQEKVLPILVTAKEMLDLYQGDTNTLILDTVKKNEIDGEKSYLVIIDALDELKINTTERFDFLRRISQTSCNEKNVKVIVTTRNIEEPELEVEIDKLYVRYGLCSLTVGEVVTLVEKFCKNDQVRLRLSKDLDKSHLFKVLPKTPISAILLAKLLNEDVQEIPSTMTELYSKYMELVLGRWDMEKGLQSQKEYDAINNVTINIADFILTNSLLEISIGDARAIFNEYVDQRNLPIEKDLVFDKLIKKSEIFQFNIIKNTLRFRHRTFAEYFYAMKLARDNSALINQDIYDLYWATIYFFFIGIKRDCPDLIKAIDNIKFESNIYRLLKIFNSGSFLLAAYLTPYDVIKKSLWCSFRDAANFYEETILNESENPLRKIPTIQLLCIITHSLCGTYSYTFFKSALEERALDLCTTNIINDIDYIELFFINSVLLSISQNGAFDTMIENYGKKIPLSIQIGILEQTSMRNTESTVVKKYLKQFKKNLKTNRNFHQAVIEMLNTPINKQEKLPNP